MRAYLLPLHFAVIENELEAQKQANEILLKAQQEANIIIGVLTVKPWLLGVVTKPSSCGI